MTTIYRNYLVTFTPDLVDGSPATVAQMEVVDAWASTGTLEDAERTLADHMARDEQGRYSNRGAGRFTVCQQGADMFQGRNVKADRMRAAFAKLMADPECAPMLDVEALQAAVDDCPDHSLAKLADFFDGRA